MATILVTGASGFIGAALVRKLAGEGAVVRAAFRRRPHACAIGQTVIVGEVGPRTDWSRALEGVASVVHLAGPAHAAHAPSLLHYAIAEATAALAEQAAKAGVSRFVFVSSIKAAASQTHGAPLSERDPAAPSDLYGAAKLAAERALLGWSEVNPVALRPPLVFAANAKGNFAHLLRLADTKLPLPFAGIENKRSLISLASLLDAVTAVLQTPTGPSGVFHVADAPALSTADIVGALRRGMGRPERQFHAPGLSMLAPPAMTTSLEVDASGFCTAYPWRADDDVRAALAACAAAWKARA